MERREIIIDFKALRSASKIWGAGGKERYYISNANQKLKVFISKKRDKDRFEIELGNGWLYMTKCYNDLPGQVNGVLNILRDSGCID